jgi:hypothetical protein
MMEEHAPVAAPRAGGREIAGAAAGIGLSSLRGIGTADGGYLIAGSVVA